MRLFPNGKKAYNRRTTVKDSYNISQQTDGLMEFIHCFLSADFSQLAFAKRTLISCWDSKGANAKQNCEGMVNTLVLKTAASHIQLPQDFVCVRYDLYVYQFYLYARV